jgi:BirA family biotin operon repressor/biotin-[acetyl-CoA-carboxylase] ligase
MLFVDQPEEFHRILPGFLPRTLRPVEQGTQDPGGDSFAMTLRDALFGPGKCPTLMTGDHSEGDPGDFWTCCYLVRRASVSQYDALRQVIATSHDLPGHVLCLALSGAGFHGQQGRPWAAETGNLHLSVGLRCDLGAAECGLALTMLPAVAVMDALSGLTVSGPRSDGLGIKWVNDILVGDRKIGGVLTSARSQDGRIRSAVLGIGLNVAVAPAVPPTLFTPGVTCLEDCMSLPQDGLTEVLRLVLSVLVRRFEELVQQGPEPLLKAYRADSVVLGRQVEIRPDGHFPGPHRKGRVLAIGPDLALTLTDDPEPVTSGRLVLLPE